MPTPGVRASTNKVVREERSAPSKLLRAIAETMKAGEEGREGLERLKAHLEAQQKNLKPSHKK